MPGNYTITIRAAGSILTAAIYNSDHQNHINNATPEALDDASGDLTAFHETADPGGAGNESYPTDLKGELLRNRYVIKEIHGGPEWNEVP